jgi:sigma-B regulation protein RsbU (phosphoserine phosphatase)
LELARHVQQGFLPKEFPFSNQLKFGQLSLFCEMLGGDLYDAFPLNETHIGFYMADVSGHGVSAALISGLLKMGMETLRPRANGKRTDPNTDIFQPRKLIETLNQRIRGSIRADEFITFCYCVYDIEKHLLKVSSAGHTPAIHYRAGRKTADFIGLRGYYPLGAFPAIEYPEESRTLEPGDKIVLYTDGITEAHSGDYDFYGETRLLNLIAQQGDRPPEDIIQSIRQSVDAHVRGERYHDDFSLLILQLLPE